MYSLQLQFLFIYLRNNKISKINYLVYYHNKQVISTKNKTVICNILH